ncbi:MAG: hypothetical protein H3C32_14525 [Anaerolineae bacterium]|nr:MAG: hypothetical protein UZ13_02600 [Chloroflexi bacterium OLB13]MBW7880516.1 hypothetical protein [Anaerolineae bacterium]
MPKLSVWLIRASLLHLGTGFLFGALVLIQKGNPTIPWAWTLKLPHTEVLVIGWTLQLIMGVSFYALPRFSNSAKYGTVRLGWWSLVLINSGVLITVAGYILNTHVVIAAGRLVALAAIVLFAILIWPRVKPFADGKVKPPQRHSSKGEPSDE